MSLNDLDINTLRALEEGLDNFALCGGDFSRQMVPRQNLYAYLAFEGNSDVYYFEGGFSEYENKKKRLGGFNSKTFEIQKTNQKLILVSIRMSITASFF
jgi:hypothetical protein